MSEKYFYITTPIFYPNAKLHFGHAVTSVYADFLARYKREAGYQVRFTSGMDEHTQKVSVVAKEEGLSERDFCDRTEGLFKSMMEALQISITDFIRTGEERHRPTAEEFWNRAKKGGYIAKKKYTGKYCVGCEVYKTDKELVDGKCPDHPNLEVEERTEENYFFELSKFEKQIRELLSKPGWVYPDHRRKEMLNFIEDGLEDVSISRSREDLIWAIPVPDDPEQMMYVWFDALTSYITPLGLGSEEYDRYWPTTHHLMAKDIARFHLLMWPAMLLAAGEPLPKKIMIHDYVKLGGQKMSKSLGNVIDPIDLVDKYGSDAVRYFILRHTNFVDDSEITLERLHEVYHDELANNLGNLVNRTVAMTERYQGGRMDLSGEIDPKIEAVIKEAQAGWNKYLGEGPRYHLALTEVWHGLDKANEYVEQTKPWELNKQEKVEELDTVLRSLLKLIYEVAVLLKPAVPETSDKIINILGVTDSELGEVRLAPGEVLFARVEE